MSNLNLGAYEPDQVAALTDFAEHINQHQTGVTATPGEVIVFDNRRVLHGRAPYRPDDLPSYDGTDRWQRRLTVSNDASRIQEFEASPRIVDPIRLLTKVAA